VQKSVASTLFVLAALVGTAPMVAQSGPASTPTLAVQGFMQAVSDSNLTKMAELWGSSKGPAARTGQPKDYNRRLVIMHAYLAGITVRTLGEVPTSKRDRTLVTTELSRGVCKITLPVTAVKTGKGWVVNQFDLALAGEVNKPCEGSGSRGNPGN
jgi:hypothetical protein